MEPDVMRLYSSSPPPMDEGMEEEDDEFGDFGGFGGALASSFSLSELDTPLTVFNQTQASDTPPPEFPIGSTAPGPCKVPLVGSNPLKQPADTAQDEPDRDSTRFEASGPRTETGSLYVNGNVAVTELLANGFPETDAQDPSEDTTASALSSSSPCVHRGSEDIDHRDTSQHKASSGEGTSLPNGFTKLHTHTKQEQSSDAPATVAPEEQETISMEEDSKPRDQGTSVEPQGPPGSGLHTQAQSGATEMPPSPSCISQDGEVLPEGQDSESNVHPADEELLTPSGPTRTSVSDDFASFCEVVSPSDLEEFGDFGDFNSTAPASTTEGPPPASVPEDDDFAGFGEAGAHSTQGFTDFSQTESGAQDGGFARFPAHFPAPSDAPPEAGAGQTHPQEAPEEDAGSEEDAAEGPAQGGQFGDLPVSDSFADFQSVPVGGGGGGGGGGMDAGEEWAAFGEPPVDDQAGAAGDGDGWAAFGEAQTETTDPSEMEEPQWQDGAAVTVPTFGSPHTSRRESLTASLSSRVQRLFQASFPHVEAPQVGEEIPSLKVLLVPQEPEPRQEQKNQTPSFSHREPQDMWWHLQEIHSAFSLKFLWGGSHSNKQLLRSLAMDTRNIVFAGQKKQPVLVPTYAASLGMLEPTKDPVNTSSAAGPVAASAQAPPGAPDRDAPSKPTQEALASVQPDWSSSGLKPPVDGVDPELYELTTATLESSNTGKNVADAFTRLMSTIDQNSTSTRRPVRDENLSEEAARVLSGLPNLSFMRAKVLMFPSILAPQPPDSPS
ncbi:aftiphilin [Alosa sapidissima]|uniref:aftiphilin n=1 Tax=Alosa sapidissima TaxID=34773 RepID=UPI001C090F60|nr:aftiphilin [Alosa sapidissima]XP_041921660.1 aftiphilin [Alosa sapidissima]